jgi:hypothetical protein
MCHAVTPFVLGAADRSDLHFAETLAMPFDTLVVSASLEFDDHDLVAPALTDDFAFDLAAGQERFADFDAGAFTDGEHLIEFDSVADGCVEALDANALTLTGAVLLTASTKNGIHDELLLDENGVGPLERLGILVGWVRMVNVMWA